MLVVRPIAKARSVEGSVQAPPSKSYTHRALAMAFLAGNARVQRPLWGADTLATRSCLERMGAEVRVGKADARVTRKALQAPEDVLDVRNSGTTLRLLAGICALLPGTSVLTGDSSIRSRPMQPLLDALQELGARAWSTRGDGQAPVAVQGPLRGGAAKLPGEVSSQFVSSLLMACPLAERDTQLLLTTTLKSRPYVDVTLAMLQHFRVKVHEEGQAFHIPAGQRYAARDFIVPGDYSSAAFPLVAAAITHGKVRVAGLAPQWPQGDRAIVAHLRAMGARVRERGGSITLESDGLHATELDLGDTPDLFPALCIAAAHAKGVSVLAGAPQLRFKESDRIKAMATGLKRMGARVHERPDGLVIHGGKPLRGAAIPTHGDHRILMSFAVAALRASSPVQLDEPRCFEVSYPGFLQDLQQLGARVGVKP